MSKPYATLLARSVADANAAVLDAGRTISLRMPILFGAPGPALLEWHRAITEKMMAMAAGSMAATVATQRLALAAGLGRVEPGRLPHEMLAVVEAATGPGYAAVAANARRLRRTR